MLAACLLRTLPFEPVLIFLDALLGVAHHLVIDPTDQPIQLLVPGGSVSGHMNHQIHHDRSQRHELGEQHEVKRIRMHHVDEDLARPLADGERRCKPDDGVVFGVGDFGADGSASRVAHRHRHNKNRARIELLR